MREKHIDTFQQREERAKFDTYYRVRSLDGGKVDFWLNMQYHRHIMMLMINAPPTRQQEQHVNKATGELAWKRRVQRSLDTRRGRDIEEWQRDKTDDCCLFVVAVFPWATVPSTFTPYCFPFFSRSHHSLNHFHPRCRPSPSLSPSVFMYMFHFIL